MKFLSALLCLGVASAATDIWVEDFVGLADGDVVDNGDTAWTATRNNGVFHMSGGKLYLNGGNSEGSLETESIDVSGWDTVKVTANFDESGNLENSDFIDVNVKFEDGTWVDVDYKQNDFGSDYTLSGTVDVSGYDSFKVDVRAKVNNNNEHVYINLVKVEGLTAASPTTTATTAATTTTVDGTVAPGPIDTCQAQHHCVQFEVIPKCKSVCGSPHSCEYEVCLTYDLDNPLCPKSSTDTVSHSCEKPNNVCLDPTPPINGEIGQNFNGGSTNVEGVPNLYKQCQTLPPGAFAEFLVKDGGGCMNSPEHSKTLDVFGLTATCAPTDVKSCSGNGNIEKECVWSFYVPDASHCPTNCQGDGGGGGDPHFKRWNRKPFQFHGECDLVLVHSDHVNGEKTLDIHVRTVIREWWSQIESAAMRLGDVTLQMDVDKFFINGKEYSDDDLPLQTDEFYISYPYEGDNQATRNLRGEGKNVLKTYVVTFNDLSVVTFKILNGFMNVAVSGSRHDFERSVGLMGDFDLGKPYNRAGERMFDLEAFAFEWQVDPSVDPMLFTEAKGPQLPHEKCRMPTVASASARRLKADPELSSKANVACSDKVDFEACVSDIINTGDVALAMLY